MGTNVDPGIFKAYDIRALYPGRINGEVARRVGRAFIDYLGGAPKRIAVGRDVRLCSPQIAGGFIPCARNNRVESTDIGEGGRAQKFVDVPFTGLRNSPLVQ